jgi:glycine cleavage system pyridoxal-binding protein P
MSNTKLTGLEDHDEFIMRHIGPRDEHVEKMLAEIGVGPAGSGE